MLTTPILEKVLDGPGFSIDLHMQATDLVLFQTLIEAQWLARIAQTHPELVERASQLGIARYHEMATQVDHVKLWPKEQRILDRDAVRALKATALFSTLRDIFGFFTLAEGFYGNTHLRGLEEIYWRLVRPHSPQDVGSLHADWWFHDMMNMHGQAFPQGAFTLKLWIPIHCEPGRNGLLIVPDSHRREWKRSTRMVNGQPKPQFDDQAEPTLLNTAPGNVVLFHERTLHGGAVNRGGRTRVSAEITLVFESERVLRQRLHDAAIALT